MATANIYIKDKLIHNLSLDELFAQIQKPKYTSFFGIVRGPHTKNAAKEAQEMLESHRRFSMEEGLVIVEIPNIPAEILQSAKAAISGSEYTYACFLDVQATGLVAIANVGNSQNNCSIDGLAAYYEQLAQLKIEISQIGGKCYMTYDPDLYLNEGCKVFKVCNTANEVNPILELMADLVPMGIQQPESAVEPDKDVSAKSTQIENAAISAIQPASTPTRVASLFGTPTIPDEFIDTLPPILKEGCSVFKEKRERDVFLTGALVVLGACMEEVYGLYDNKKTYPNLYAFVVAPAASGKGTMDYSRKLGDALNKKYQLEGQGSMKTLFIPGNISASMVIHMLNASNGKGVFYETETDTLSNALKKEWGDFSDILRKGSESERISQARIANAQFDVIDEPRLSLLVSGTPEQVKGLIPSTENGLFSRIMFYAFESPLKFKDVRPSKTINFIDHFKGLSDRSVQMEEFLGANPTYFSFTDAQWDKFHEDNEKMLIELASYVSTDLIGTSLRLGGIHFKISMILSALRKADAKNTDAELICSDEDYTIGRKLALLYLEHAKIIYGHFPKQSKSTSKPIKTRFLDALPSGEFGTTAIAAAARHVQVADRTAYNYLDWLIDAEYIERQQHGTYKKA